MLSVVLSVRGSGFEPAPRCQGLLHRQPIGPLVAGQDRLRALPASKRAEILERGVLHFRRELPTETVPAAARLGREFGNACPRSHQSPRKCREIGVAGSEGAGKTHSLITGCARRVICRASTAAGVSHVSCSYPILSFSAHAPPFVGVRKSGRQAMSSPPPYWESALAVPAVQSDSPSRNDMVPLSPLARGRRARCAAASGG